MPPKAKYTREEIVETAFQMTRENGIESVMARELGKRLGTSSSPIFTAFKNMEELQEEVRKLAMKKFEEYVGEAVNYRPAFKEVGMRMTQFAMEEPKLFQFLYMREHKNSQTHEDMMGELGDLSGMCVDFIKKEHDLCRRDAEALFRQVWLHTFGICVLIVSKVCIFTPEEISEMLSVEFQGALMLIKSGEFKVVEVQKQGGNCNENHK